MSTEPLAPAPLTLMAVHAHPDDEVVFTGGVFPYYHDAGVRTVLVCCTGGEEGEIHDPDLDPEAARPELGAIRERELRCAADHMGVDVLELLGYRDSGMAGTPANADPACFHQAPLDEATARLVALVRRYRPQVLVTYDEFGAYGHPDHIGAHKITHAAWDASADPAYHPDLGAPWAPLKLYWAAWPEEPLKQAREMYIARGLKWPWDREQTDVDSQHESDEEGLVDEARAEQAAAEAQEPPPYQPPPTTTKVDVRAVVPRKLAAFACHRTQFSRDGLFLTIPEDIARVAWGEDHFILVQSRLPATPPETDLFAGVPRDEGRGTRFGRLSADR